MGWFVGWTETRREHTFGPNVFGVGKERGLAKLRLMCFMRLPFFVNVGASRWGLERLPSDFHYPEPYANLELFDPSGGGGAWPPSRTFQDDPCRENRAKLVVKVNPTGCQRLGCKEGC